MRAAERNSLLRFIRAARGLCIIAIYESSHTKLKYFGTVGAHILGSIAVRVIDIESSAAAEGPYGRRGATTLAGAKYRIFI
jgi:hypothetical protein